MIFINKSNNSISAYTYLLKFNVGHETKYYYGVRYGNVRLGLKPSDDLFKKYFTSSKSVKNLIQQNILPSEIIIHKVFENYQDACKFEVDFLTRIGARNRKDFINLVSHFDNSLPYSHSNNGRVLSTDTKIKIGKASSEWQSSEEYKEYRSDQMKKKWSDPEYKKYMLEKNNNFWKGEVGQNHIKTRRPATLGHKHTEETKSQMSESAKIACRKIDCKERASKRKRYTCPICDKSNLDGGNFNSHMMSRHEWDKEACTYFKNYIQRPDRPSDQL